MISRYVCTVGINEVSKAGCLGVRRLGAGDPPGPGDHRHQDQGGGGHRGRGLLGAVDNIDRLI